jgi:transcriptional accessory protein Tex/SPT6
MKHIQEIARRVRRPEEQLRFPCELLQQGYEANYLANYRPDELSNIDEATLSAIRRMLKQFESVEAHRAKVLASIEKEPLFPKSVLEIVQQSRSIAEIDTTLRHVRARKNAKSIAEKCPAAEIVGKAILTYTGEMPKDFPAWVAGVANVTPDLADETISQTKSWLSHLLSEDLKLMSEMQQYVLRRAVVSVKILPEPTKESEETHLEASEDSATVPVHSIATAESKQDAAPEITPASNPDQTLETSEATPPTVNAENSQGLEQEAVPQILAEFSKDKKSVKPLKTKSLSEKQLSPRKRRRRWLRSILESYARLKKPAGDLTPYQILMLSRGLRSQIIQLNFDYDKKPLIQMCREALCPGRHPMHSFLMETADSALHTFLLPRIHQDVMAILEEYANEELTEAAVAHLQGLLLQRPIKGHRILMIDAIGPKMAAAAIVDADGRILFTGELPCNTNRADVVAQNVVLMGQWVHEHRVTLISLSNGPARRYLVQPIAELLKQTSEGSLQWTMVDRAGADAYCSSRICLVELPNISKRHRAAVWLARRLQDPLRQVLKVDPTRLRLGSYQRELPQAELEIALRDAVSSAISQSGLDIFSAEPEVLQRAPGMTFAAAKAVVQACREERITNRESLLNVLKEHLTEMQARQAIGFLRVFGSDNSLDATTIHPDDYRLAKRLVEHANLPTPAPAPEGWQKPNFEDLVAASEAAEDAIAKRQEESGNASDESSEENMESTEADFHESENLSDSDSSGPIAELDTKPENQAAVPTSENENGESPSSDAPSSESIPSDGSEVELTESNSTAGTVETPGTASNVPPIEKAPRTREVLSIDAERLARSWQVGREKLRRVAYSLQFPFADEREFQYPVPVSNKFPRLDTLKQGDMVQALVVGVTDFGVFVDLGPDCSGLIHVSRITPKYVEDPHQYVQLGDLLTAWVINIDEKRKRVALTAIPPGTQNRKGQDSGTDSTSESSTRDRRPPRPSADGRGRGDNRTRSDSPRSANTGSDRGPNQRGESRGGRPPSSGPSRGGFRGRGDRGRSNERVDSDQSVAPRKPARITPPKPITPITDAMQQGKEPLRSFSDLMQFMKKSKPENEEIVPSSVIEPSRSDSQSPAPAESSGTQSIVESNESPNGPIA